jgi:Protein of unknown function (DUF3467)
VDDAPQNREVTFDFEVPPEARTGVYANTVNIWHSPYEFSLDWALTEPIEAIDPDDPESPLRVPGSVVARVRIPVGLVFDVMRALNEAMTGYEAIFGEIRRPEALGEEEEPDSLGDET